MRITTFFILRGSIIRKLLHHHWHQKRGAIITGYQTMIQSQTLITVVTEITEIMGITVIMGIMVI